MDSSSKKLYNIALGMENDDPSYLALTSLTLEYQARQEKLSWVSVN